MLASSIKQFKYYKQLAEKTIAQTDNVGLFHRFHDDDNTIAIIVQHMSGNMKSRWTNIFEEDGEKPWRNRDSEFDQIIDTRKEMTVIWDGGWRILFDTLESLREEDLRRIIYIRNEGMTVEDAIIRQLCHYSYHVGQIVYKGKQLSNGTWRTLSIARNDSKAYNFKKIEQIKEEKHFLDNLLDESP